MADRPTDVLEPPAREPEEPAARHEPGGTGERAVRPALIEALGGRRGLLDSGLPALVFVAVNAALHLRAAIVAAVAVGVALVLLRLVRREPLQQALSGFFGLALAAFIAARTGRAEGFFLPGIVLNVLYAVGVLVSVAIGRPIVGVVIAAVEGSGAQWRSDRRLRRAYARASLGWAAVYLVRAGVQAAFYLAHRPGWLAVTKLGLGWPVTIAAVALTLAYTRRVARAGAVDQVGAAD
ncbi:MAG: DUF3159 domain-containing protein [Actinomycetota bacterium]|nr:DUF3159 domain-containing protein [Actinomycetota bacterium]